MEGEKVGEVILTMKDIDKSLPGVHALKKVNLEDVYKRQCLASVQQHPV